MQNERGIACIRDPLSLLEKLRHVNNNVEVYEEGYTFSHHDQKTNLFPLGLPSSLKGKKKRSYVVVQGTRSQPLRSFSDAFQYSIRSKCSRHGNARGSLRDFVSREYKRISKSVKKSGRNPDRCNILLAANMMAYQVCDSFDVTIAQQLMRMFGATRVLDFCAGWGDRLIAAIALDIPYTGIDINSRLFPGYSETIRTLVKDPKRRKNYVMLNGPAETTRVSDDVFYDLIFTSPPYFASEVYSNNPSDLNRHQSSLEAWFCGFMTAALESAWRHLAVGGHALIAIGDAWDENGDPIAYTERLNVYVGARLPGATYVGTVGMRYPYRRREKVNPVWVWKKAARTSSSSRSKYAKALANHYGDFECCS